MHFIDVGFRSSCSSSTDFYYSEIDLYGLNENDEEVNIISWIDINERHIEKYNTDINSRELFEIKQLLIIKQNGYSNLNFSFIDDEKFKRKELYATN